MIRFCISAICAAILAFFPFLSAIAQAPPHAALPSSDSAQLANRVVLVLPFHNRSKAPGLEWIGEAFAEVLGQRMQSQSLFVISREDRLNAFDRVGIPLTAQLSRATLLRLAEQMDVDYVVLGDYNYDGNVFAAKAQLLDMRRLHLSPPVTETGSLLQLVDIQAATGWDLVREIQPEISATKQDFIAETKDIRLDALENYVRGVIAAGSTEKIRRFKEAVRLNPNYTLAMLQLGKTYFDQRDYASAVAWLDRIPTADKHATEANFFSGLAAYSSGNMARASESFRFVAARLPLSEVYNNLGVVESKRSKSASIDYFEKAVQADATDADYQFNLAVALVQSGDTPAAIRHLKESLGLRPDDGEAKTYLQALSASTVPPNSVRPQERIKRTYSEASFRQLAFAVENAEEVQMAHSDPKKHAAMHIDEGKQQLRQGFYEQARDNFRKALQLDPANSDAHLGLASAQIALNDLTGARSELDSTLRAQPTSEAYVTLGQLNLKENNLLAADEAIAEALRLEPGNSEALQMKQQLGAKLNLAKQENQ